MANINTYLQAILQAVYGEDVRGSIHDAIALINDVSEVVFSTGTAVTGPTSSSTGFFEDSLYLNLNTYELWKCIGTDTWQSLGILKGPTGNGIDNIRKTGTSGLVDTYTITYTDGNTDTFTVTNGKDGADGADGKDGSHIYRGTGISGKAVSPTVYSGSGVTKANADDLYLNPTEGAIYHCVTGGDASTATWSYDFTMSGGGGGGSYSAGTGIDIDVNDVISVDPGSIAHGEDRPPKAGDVYDELDKKVDKNQGIAQAGKYLKVNASGEVEPAEGGGGGLLPYFFIESEAGASVTVVNANDPTEVITPTAGAAGHWECEIPHYGIWTVHSTLSGQGDATINQTVDDVKQYHITDMHYAYTLNINAPAGSTIQIQQVGGAEQYTGTGTGSLQPFVVHQASTQYNITITLDGGQQAQTITSPSATGGSTNLVFTFGTITVNVDAEFITAGTTITCTKGAKSCTAKVADTTVTFRPCETGTWEVATIMGTDTFDVDAEVTSLATAVTVDLAPYIVFAFHYSENDSDPDSVTYPSVVPGTSKAPDNYGWTPFQMDFTTGIPNYGSWDPAGANANKLKWFYPKSCMLKYDGTVDYYLKEDDETKKADGTASDVASTAYGGNAMMEWGQDGKMIYWKVVPDNDGKGFTFVVANGKSDNDMKPWNHYDANDNLTPHFYTAKYFGSNVSSKLRSISGQTNMVSQTRNTEVTYARANNTGADVIWDTEVYADWFLIGMLCCLMGKSMNTQAKFGKGNNNTSAAIGQGTMNGKGQFYGKNDNGSGVKVFGMENFWGNIWRAIRGLVTDSSVKAKVKLTHGTADGTSVSDYNFDGTGYITRSTITGTTGGYISAMDIDAKGLLPKTVSGSETTYYTDGCWFAASCYALVGGVWSIAGHDGALCCNLGNAASVAVADLGAALSCKPLAA